MSQCPPLLVPWRYAVSVDPLCQFIFLKGKNKIFVDVAYKIEFHQTRKNPPKILKRGENGNFILNKKLRWLEGSTSLDKIFRVGIDDREKIDAKYLSPPKKGLQPTLLMRRRGLIEILDQLKEEGLVVVGSGEAEGMEGQRLSLGRRL